MKKSIILILVLITCCLLSNYSAAQDDGVLSYFTCYDYLFLSELDDISQTFYLMGLRDMLMNTLYDDWYATYVDFSISIGDLTGYQLKNIFDNYLEEYPESWDYTVASVFEIALWKYVYPEESLRNEYIDSLLKELIGKD